MSEKRLMTRWDKPNDDDINGRNKEVKIRDIVTAWSRMEKYSV